MNKDLQIRILQMTIDKLKDMLKLETREVADIIVEAQKEIKKEMNEETIK